jgi:hypothetical protein
MGAAHEIHASTSEDRTTADAEPYEDYNGRYDAHRAGEATTETWLTHENTFPAPPCLI